MDELYNKCYDIVCTNEGGYVNDPDDKGGETYKGVARRYNEDWKGWQIIDRYKAIIEHESDGDKLTSKELQKRMNALLKGNNEIDGLIRDLYKGDYWKPCKCDDLGEVSHRLALYAFDFAVNSGVSRACKELQKCVGVEADGKIGTKSLAAIKAAPASLASDYLQRRRDFINNGKKIATKFKKGLNNRLDHLASVEI